jgi:hypothetical protein
MLKKNKNGDSAQKKLTGVVAYMICVSGFALANAISISSTAFTNVTTFDSLGTGGAVWNDGNTIQGVYLNSTVAGIPTNLTAQTGGNASGGAYNVGLSGDSDRALGWLTTSAIGTAYTGIQFRDQTGSTNAKTINYSLVLEQWGDRNTSAQNFTLQYRVNSTGGNSNNLLLSGWIDLGTGTTPVIGDGVEPHELNGNLNQFTIAGTATIVIKHGQFLTFRLVDVDHSGGDAMVGIESFTLQVVASSLAVIVITANDPAGNLRSQGGSDRSQHGHLEPRKRAEPIRFTGQRTS